MIKALLPIQYTATLAHTLKYSSEKVQQLRMRDKGVVLCWHCFSIVVIVMLFALL